MSNLSSDDNEHIRIQALEQLNLLHSPVEERFDRLCNMAIKLFDVPYCCITLIDDKEVWFKSAPNLGQLSLVRANSLYELTLCSEQPTIITEHYHQFNSTSLLPNVDVTFYAGVALTIDNQFNVGTLCLFDTKKRLKIGIDIELLIELGKVISSELSSTYHHNVIVEQRKSIEKLDNLRTKTLELVATAQSLYPILLNIVNQVELQFPNMICSILLLDKKNKTLKLGAAPSLPNFYNQAIEGIKIGFAVGACGTAAFTGKRVIVEDIEHHPYWQKFIVLAQQAKLGSCWSEPILDRNGEVLGTFAIYHQQKSTPTSYDFKLIEQSAYLASISIEREFNNDLVWQQANYDDLTGLPNRHLIKEHLKLSLENAKRHHTKLALLFLDFDLFKQVNDTFGHDIGDLLLIESASRIKQSLRNADSVARLGGDEFIIIINELHNKNEAKHIAKKIQQSLSKVFKLEQYNAFISSSIGITVYPDDGITVNILLKNADQAMFRAKELGRARYHFFTQDMKLGAQFRSSLTKQLHHALSNDEFFIEFQPIFNIINNKIIGAEALIRWHHPTLGTFQPQDFIHLAEKSGLILPINDWVFEQIIKLLIEWDQQLDSDFQLTINTSNAQFRENNKNIEHWIKKLIDLKIPPNRLCLELKENLFTDQSNVINQQLSALNDTGVSVAIDNFGNGLGYLNKFKIDCLKIDKSFTNNITHDKQDKTLCETIVMLADKLNIKAIAQGIETEQQLQSLLEAGCQFGQGFYLDKPMSAADLKQKLIKQTRDNTGLFK